MILLRPPPIPPWWCFASVQCVGSWQGPAPRLHARGDQTQNCSRDAVRGSVFPQPDPDGKAGQSSTPDPTQTSAAAAALFNTMHPIHSLHMQPHDTAVKADQADQSPPPPTRCPWPCFASVHCVGSWRARSASAHQSGPNTDLLQTCWSGVQSFHNLTPGQAGQSSTHTVYTRPDPDLWCCSCCPMNRPAILYAPFDCCMIKLLSTPANHPQPKTPGGVSHQFTVLAAGRPAPRVHTRGNQTQCCSRLADVRGSVFPQPDSRRQAGQSSKRTLYGCHPVARLKADTGHRPRDIDRP
jgi:hypothetical protein